MIVNLTHAVALVGIVLAVSPIHVLAQDAAESVPVTPMPWWMRFAFFSLFAFALVAGGVAIGAAFRNKVIYTLTRGMVGALLGGAFLVQFAPAWLYLMGPVFGAFLVIGFQRYLAIFNDRSTPGPGWQWSRPPRTRHWRRFNLRAGVWEGRPASHEGDW